MLRSTALGKLHEKSVNVGKVVALVFSVRIKFNLVLADGVKIIGKNSAFLRAGKIQSFCFCVSIAPSAKSSVASSNHLIPPKKGY